MHDVLRLADAICWPYEALEHSKFWHGPAPRVSPVGGRSPLREPMVRPMFRCEPRGDECEEIGAVR